MRLLGESDCDHEAHEEHEGEPVLVGRWIKQHEHGNLALCLCSNRTAILQRLEAAYTIGPVVEPPGVRIGARSGSDAPLRDRSIF